MSPRMGNRAVGRRLLHQRGMTLIELIIVVAVIATLAGVAYPGYRQHVQQARVVDGQAMLLELAGQLERCFTRHNSYQGCLELPVVSRDGHYDITGDPGAVTYELTATHTGNGVLLGCRKLTLDQAGVTTPTPCW